MKYKEIPHQSTKFRTKKWVEVNDDTRGTYDTDSQIKFKNSMLKSSSFDYSDAYILVSGSVEIQNTGMAAVPNNRKNIIIKNCAPFTDCISEINNIQIDDDKDINGVMSMYNLTLIWVGFLGVGFEVRGSKITPCLKPVRIMLETWQIWHVSTHPYVLSENIPFSA